MARLADEGARRRRRWPRARAGVGAGAFAVGARGAVRAGQRRHRSRSRAACRSRPTRSSSWPSSPTPRTSTSSSSGRRRRSSPGWPICCALAGAPCSAARARRREIEGSKVFAKELMQRHAVPTARVRRLLAGARGGAVHRRARASECASAWSSRPTAWPPARAWSSRTAPPRPRPRCARMLAGDTVGDAGRRVVVEEFLVGREASLMALVDGERVTPLVPCRGPQDGARRRRRADDRRHGRGLADAGDERPRGRARRARGARADGARHGGRRAAVPRPALRRA